MANLYTKGGDKGETSLFGGQRVEKNNLKVDCYGTIDEAISMLGLSYSQSKNESVKTYIKNIQSKLFVVGAELASDEKGLEMLVNIVTEDDVGELENIVDECSKLNGPQTNFIIPGKNQASASAHVARTIIRRAERKIITLSKEQTVRNELLKYINRLSDAIYAIARLEETYCKIDEIKDKVVQKINKLEEVSHIQQKSISVNKYDTLSLEMSKEISDYICERALQVNIDIVCSIVDKGGNIILLHRMEDSLLASIDISINKAYTSNALKMPTHKLATLSKPGEALYGIQNTNENKIVVFGGGYPIIINNKVVGGLGVSGGSVEEDMDIASYALKKMNLEYEK